ncbi:MAG: hypothetical protein HFI39_01320 [Lachnospiraceae bacterium]|nr:hypothetical protein [Lachnospiraceae bacterium]
MNKRLDRSNVEVDARTGRIEKACAKYGVGRNTMRQIAEQAGAVIRFGRNYLIDFKRIDEFLDSLAGNK